MPPPKAWRWQLVALTHQLSTLDRVEDVITGGLAVGFLAGAPLATVAAWHAAYSCLTPASRPCSRQAPGALLTACHGRPEHDHWHDAGGCGQRSRCIVT